MKKILLLVMVLVGLLSTVSAKEFNEARWQWFYSNANYTGKIDLNTLSYDPETDVAEAWAVWIIPENHKQNLRSYDINFKRNNITVKEYYLYKTGSDQLVKSEMLNVSRTPAPGSGEEALIAAVKGLVGRDTKLAALKKEREEEAQRRLEEQRAEEQKRLEEQKAFEEKQKAAQKEAEKRNRVATIGGILGSLFGI